MLSPETDRSETNIKFNGEDRKISIYVPKDYNGTKECTLMICLHGAQNNSANYLNILTKGLKWQECIPNTIFIAPDGGSDPSKDFYTPQGDEAIIDSVIKFAKKNYLIKEDRIILQGHSLGGRSALKYGLDNPEKFYGLLLNTPAIQSTNDAQNVAFASLVYNYKNSSKLPIAITIGEKDQGYFKITRMLMDSLVFNDAKVKLYSIPELGHSLPENETTKECMLFINHNENYLKNNDVEVYTTLTPVRRYDSLVSPSFVLRNVGLKTANKIRIQVTNGNENKSFVWNGELKPYQHVLLNAPEIKANAGENKAMITVDSINNMLSYTTSSVNGKITKHPLISSQIDYFSYLNKSENLPLLENFESKDFPSNNWYIEESGNTWTWHKSSLYKKSGNYSATLFNLLIKDNRGASENLYTPPLNLKSADKPYLYFNMAFNYVALKPPYSAKYTMFSDTLEIQISTDKEKTFTTIFKKWGADLATMAIPMNQPIINPKSIEDYFIKPMEIDWKQIAINLGAYKNADMAVIKFKYISGAAGNIYIDDIEVKNAE